MNWRTTWLGCINTILAQNPVSFTATIGMKSMTRYTSPRSRSEPSVTKQVESSENEPTLRNVQSLSPDQILTFGKHKGKTIGYVLKYDPGWLRWALTKGIIKQQQLPEKVSREISGREEEQMETEEILHELFPRAPAATSTERKVVDDGTIIGGRQRIPGEFFQAIYG